MSPSKAVEAEKTQRAQLQLWMRIAEICGTVITTGIRYGGVVALGYFAFRSIESLAGRTTLADIFVMGNLQASVVVSWAVGVGGVAYGWRQRRLRHTVNETLGVRVADLEQQLDSKRSSSKLTKTGQTDPKDLL
jgi:hypothetical protein